MEEEEDLEHREGQEGAGDFWHLFVRLLQEVWQNGHIPQQLCWVIIVLIPKGAGQYQGISRLVRTHLKGYQGNHGQRDHCN